MHLKQPAVICNSVAISADFSEEIEDSTASETVCDQQFSVTQFFSIFFQPDIEVFFAYITIMEPRTRTNIHCSVSVTFS